MDDMGPLDCGERIVAAFELDGYIHAVSETGAHFIREWSGVGWVWSRQSGIPRLSYEETQARNS